ncbi:MAG: phosphatase domain-containing protein [Myxococcota bacterium]
MGIFSRGPKPPYEYPLERTNDRHFSEGWSGPLYVWDIDKTYLATEIHNLRGLLAVPFEFAIDKRNVAGTAALLRALRRGKSERGLTKSNPIYFVSASPPQLRRVIQRKMLLDGVEFDGITFKDQLELVKRRQLGKLREQIGYKLSALLLNRRELPWSASETLFGDDSESDALVYTIYGDTVAGRLRGERLVKVLSHNGVAAEDGHYVASLADGMPEKEIVRGIYINLEVRRNPELFEGFSPRVVPCHDTFQAALRLYEDGHIAVEGVLDVAEQLVVTFARRPPSLLRSAADMVARRGVGLATVAELWDALQARELAPDYFVVDPGRLPMHPPPNVPSDGWLTPERARPHAL